MPLACGMAGPHRCWPHTVFVDKYSLLPTHCPAPLDDNLLKEVCCDVTVEPPLQPSQEKCCP